MTATATKTTGVKEEIKRLKGIAARADDLSKAAVKVWNLAEDDFKKKFKSAPATTASGEVYGGARWPRLSEAYLARRPDRKTGRQLTDTRELAKSFRRGQPGNIATVRGNVIEFGSSLPKAEGLNEKRQLNNVHQALIDSAEEILNKYVTGQK